jgi:Ca-activated chloride channel family protein
MWTYWQETSTHFARPALLAVLLIVPLLAILGWRAEVWRRRALSQLGSSRQVRELEMRRQRNRFWSRLALQLGLALLILAAAGPQWGRDWEASTAPGRDLILVIDVSGSMTAEQPSRLDLVRRAVADLLASIRQRGGHRIGIVLFAGRPQIVCPLTQDYDHVENVMDQLDELRLDPDLGPGPRGPSGTRIAAGVQEAMLARDEHSAGVCDVLLFSDGDDPASDGEWEYAVPVAKGEGIPISVVGVGDPVQDSTIPTPDGPQRDRSGRIITTRLEEDKLRKIAQETGGQYIPARRTTVPLGTIYRESIATLPRRDQSVDALPTQKAQYRTFLMPALFLLVVGLTRRD